MKRNAYSVIIGGDIVSIGKGEALFAKGDALSLIGSDLCSIIQGASFSVFNLEAPLIEKKSPIEKCGPNLSSSLDARFGLSAINPGAFSLANNHIMDHGERGLRSTMKALDSVGARYFGAGCSVEEARKPLVVTLGEMNVGFLSFAEHEFSVANKDSFGANPYDPLTAFDDIAKLKQSCDKVIVLYHGGKEYYRYPSPNLQLRCRKMVAAGADVVACQHSHCVGCYEEYLGGTIVYGQGNFLFDDGEDDYLNSGLLLEFRFANNWTDVSYIPVIKNGVGVLLAKGDLGNSILDGFEQRSKNLLIDGFVENEYASFADNYINTYLADFIPGSKTKAFRLFNKLSGGKLAKNLTSRIRLLIEINRIECESHNELFLLGLKRLHAQKKLGENNERDS